MYNDENRTAWYIKIGVGVVTILIGLTIFAYSCTTVPPGYAGIKVNNLGKNRGVQHLPIVTGLVFYNPFTEDVHKFPTFLQTEKWTAGNDEGSPANQSITFNSIEGATINVDVGASVQFIFDSIPAIFVEFRTDPQIIIDGFVRNQVRDAFSRAGSKMKTTEIFGNGKQALVDTVNHTLKASLGTKGILVDNISIIGEMRVDAAVKASINAVLTATQRAIEAENKVNQAIAESEQKIATARGDSTALVITAAGNAEANRLNRLQITPELIQIEWIKKWDGIVPMYTGAGQALFTMPGAKN